ncbi:MAG: helix-turn-helix transcriptional regulator [Candidatus Thiodiazotropha sp.]
MDIFPTRLKAARKAKRYTQRELASLVGMDQGHISRLENGGKGVSIEHIQALAKELDVTVSHLLGEEIKDETGAYIATGERATILSNYEAPPGLRELASNDGVIDTLKITDADWVALNSIQLPDGVSMDGYVQLMITVRAITQR